MSKIFTSRATRAATALLVVILLVLTVLPLNMSAESLPQTSQSQIQGNVTPLYFGADVSPDGVTDPKKTIEHEAEELYINMSKSIAGTDVENEFLLTLEVETNSQFNDNPRSDAAVVIVLDISGSMLKNQTGGGTIQPFSERRLTKAVRAINEFIDGFAQVKDNSGNSISGERWISIVAFGSNGNTHVLRDWVNIGNEQGISLADPTDAKIFYSANSDDMVGILTGDSNVTPSLDTAQLTCMSQGLSKAITQLTSFVPTKANIDVSLNTVLFTDGYPNQNDGGGSGSNSKPSGFPGSHDDVHFVWAEYRADVIKQLGSNLFTIAYGDDVHSQWLSNTIASNVNYSFDGINGFTLTDIFKVINNQINTLADAWLVTDPMGEHIQFIETKTDNLDSVNFNTGTKTIDWDLKTDPSIVANSDTGVKNFKLTYLVRLDTIAIAEDNWNGNVSEYLPTNKTTTLSYVFEGVDSDGDSVFSEKGTANFLIPNVQGYRDAFSFIKNDDINDIPLKGAEFQIYLGTGENKAAYGNLVISGENGLTDFGRLPSGHTYTLIEEKSPDGFARDLTEYIITVSYGDISFTPQNELLTKIDDVYVFINEPDAAKIGIDKKVALALSYTDPSSVPDDAWQDSLSVTTNGAVRVYYRITVTLLRGDYTVTGTVTDAVLGDLEWDFTVSPDAKQFKVYTNVVEWRGNGAHPNVAVIDNAEIPEDDDGFTPDVPVIFDPGESDANVIIRPEGGPPDDPQPGSLVIRKVFSGVTAPSDWNATFTVTGPNFNATYSYSQLPVTINGLTSGTYTVSESNMSNIPGYVFVGSSGSGSPYNVTTNSTVTATITNTYSTGETPPDVPPPTDIPDETPPLIDIPGENTPTPPTEIIDEDTPLTGLPQTGTSMVFIPLAVAGFVVLCAGLLLKGKKPETDESENNL